MRKLILCLIIGLLSACSSPKELQSFVKDESTIYTQFESYQKIEPKSIRVINMENNIIGMQPITMFDADENQIAEIMNALSQIQASYQIERDTSMTTQYILQFMDIDGNVWVMEELWDGLKSYMSFNETKYIVEVDQSLKNMIDQMKPTDTADKWEIRVFQTPPNYSTFDSLDEALVNLVKDELTERQLEELNAEEGTTMKAYNSSSFHKEFIHLATHVDEKNHTTNYFYRFSVKHYQDALTLFYAKQNKELFSPLSWLIYHPQDAEIVKVEMNEGIRTATVIQKENIPYDTSVKRSDFMLSEEGRYMLQVNSKQAYLLDNVPDAYIFIKTAYLKLNQLHENNDFISLSYEQNTGRNYLFDKQSGISQSDEMVLDQYFDGDVASVVDVVEKQLGLAMCEYNDYDSTKDIPACLEIEWTRNGLEEVEDRLIYSAFHVNEDGKLVLDVYVKVYGFRDHVESVVLE